MTRTRSTIELVKELVAAEISAAREAAGLTLQQLASATRGERSLNPSSLSQYESGQVVPRWLRLCAILDACGRDPTEQLRRAYNTLPEGRISQQVAAPRQMAEFKRFIRIWQSSQSVQEAADRLGISKAAASSRAAMFRRRGVPLRAMSRGRIDVDWIALRDFAEGLSAETPGEAETEDREH